MALDWTRWDFDDVTETQWDGDVSGDPELATLWDGQDLPDAAGLGIVARLIQPATRVRLAALSTRVVLTRTGFVRLPTMNACTSIPVDAVPPLVPYLNTQGPDDALRYSIDAAVLDCDGAGVVLQAVTWDGAGLTVDQDTFDTLTASARIAGGVAGTVYTVTVSLTLSDGQALDVALRIGVQDYG